MKPIVSSPKIPKAQMQGSEGQKQYILLTSDIVTHIYLSAFKVPNPIGEVYY